MLRILGTLVSVSLFASVAIADCERLRRFDACIRNVAGQVSCPKTCSPGQLGCIGRCGGSQTFSSVPFKVAVGAECPARSGRYCSDQTPYCCVAADGTAYCATDITKCTR